MTDETERRSLPVRRDLTYFLPGNFAHFQVQNRLFRIPSFLFTKQSRFFARLLSSNSESNPIFLRDITVEEFHHFLQISFPSLASNPREIWTGMPPEEAWISVLKLSTMWKWLEMRELAIEILNSKFCKNWAPATSIQLGRRYFIEKWLVSGYKKPLARREGLSDEEVMEIGPLESVRLMRMRESPYYTGYVELEIKKLFKGEFESIATQLKDFLDSTANNSDEENKESFHMY